MNNKGKIFIAGAGPGDIELITVKLQLTLSKADVILYDYLVNKAMLLLCRNDAIQISVGKSGALESKHKFIQEDIHKLMIKYAKQGKVVLRLKGGDPFIFGRGSEECEEIAKTGIDFEVIPGISSAIAGPAYAGIPLTHRGISRSVAIATGHLRKQEDSNNIKIPNADTIVFVMAIKNIAIIVNKFFNQEYPKETKCALIENACSPAQRTFVTTLGDVCEVCDKNKVSPPALFVVGDVIALRENLAWYEKKPLFGKTFLVTRAQKQASGMSAALRELGAKVIEFPVIEIVRIKNAEEILLQQGYLDKFTDIIFTSVNGVEIFFDILFKGELDSRILFKKTILSIGKVTANKLLQYGIKADIVPDIYQSEGILQKLGQDLSKRKFLLPRAKDARPFLIDEVRLRRGEIEELLLYQAKLPCEVFSIEDSARLDGICFTSTSTVINFCKINPNFKNTKVFAIGEITAKSASDSGFKDIEISQQATINSVVEKIIEVTK
ncbi:MAG: uroporphyrinogen-III C-methyltransferase [Candidatus Omnitrophota bacterium]